MSIKKLQIVEGSLLQSDWNETDPNKPYYIKNKPNIPKEFTGSFSDLTNIPDLQEKPHVITMTFSPVGWSGDGPYYQTLSLSKVTANSKIDITADSNTISSILSGGYCLSVKNDNGSVTIYSIGTKPTTDLTLQLNISEVSKKNSTDVIWGAPLIGSSGGFVVSVTEPTNTNVLWVDTTNGLKYYNGTEWVVVPVAYS